MISLLILSILLIGIYYNLCVGRYTIFLSFYIILLCFYDYLFIEINYILPNNLVFSLKPFQEISFLLILILLIYRKGLKIPLNKSYYFFYICIVIPLISVLLNSILSAFSISAIILGLRHFFLVPITVFFFYSNNILTFNWKILYGLVLIIVLYAIYQLHNFNGDLTQLWFYKFFESNGDGDLIIKGSFNYVKDGILRCTSLFISAIDFSSVCAIMALFFSTKYLFRKKFLDLLFTFIALYGLYLSQTRIGILAYILGLGIIIIYKYKSFYQSPINILLCPFIFILLTFIFLIFNPGLDLSALGRLVQYADLPSLIKTTGKGIGIEKNVMDYDSFILSSINIFGLLGIVYLFFYFYSVYNLIIAIKRSNSLYYEEVFAVASGCSLIYMFAFHHLAGSFIGSFILIVIYSSLGKLNRNNLAYKTPNI